MRTLFSKIVTITLTAVAATTTAHAIVVKPLNSIVAAKGTAKISNKDFFYSVQDRGWSLDANIEKNDNKVESKKQFLINYIEATESSSPLALSEKVEIDAAQKCTELGNSELPNKTLPPDWKTELSAQLIDHEVREYAKKFYGTYVCRVLITSTR